MGADLELAWHHANTTATTRKRIIRAVIREIVVAVCVFQAIVSTDFTAS
ncbi:hypothetical protein RFN25_28030 [Mesorhizobium abyssinicae]|nr:hypothetical protein [Mesorhizobium abyssinicae]MDX8437266.1 hypothetical protein [Mesorhizobium abyssinicae]